MIVMKKTNKLKGATNVEGGQHFDKNSSIKRNNVIFQFVSYWVVMPLYVNEVSLLDLVNCQIFFVEDVQ